MTKELQDALRAFSKAAQELKDKWIEADADLSFKYPFWTNDDDAQDFNEVVNNIAEWVANNT